MEMEKSLSLAFFVSTMKKLLRNDEISVCGLSAKSMMKNMW